MAFDLVTIFITTVFNQLIGPTGKHLGEMLLEQGKQVGSKAVSMLAAVGREPQAVEPKILIPLVYAAALETDETLADKWAALLANAADPAKLVDVTPAFVEVMRQLAPIDTLVLNRLYFPHNGYGEVIGELSRVEAFLDTDVRRDFPGKGEISIDNLIRLGLAVNKGIRPQGYFIAATGFGFAFMKACMPPK